jgi:hypothetical protein
LQGSEAVEVNNSTRRVDETHVRIDTDAVKPSGFYFFEDIRPQRGDGQPEGVEFTRTGIDLLALQFDK